VGGLFKELRGFYGNSDNGTNEENRETGRGIWGVVDRGEPLLTRREGVRTKAGQNTMEEIVGRGNRMEYLAI
jgi:hypothetical protein